MAIDLGAINWLAVIVGTLIYFALGAVWFAPATPLGRAWVSASGYESPTTGMASSNLFYVVPVAGALVAVLATALLAAATATDTATEGVVLGLVGIGYAAAILLTTAALEFAKPRRCTWWIMDADGGNAAPVDATIPALTAAGCTVCPFPDDQGQFWGEGGLNTRLWQPVPGH